MGCDQRSEDELEGQRPGPWIEYLLLAKHVDSAEGLIYVSGGGMLLIQRRFDSHGVPLPNHLGIVLGFRFPRGTRGQMY